MNQLRTRKYLSLLLTVFMIFSLFSTPLYANELDGIGEEGTGEEGVIIRITKEVSSFVELSTEVKNQTYLMGTSESELTLPETLAVSGTIETDGVSEDVDSVEVSAWEADPVYDPETQGTYVFSPVIDSTWNVLAELSTIEVLLMEATTENEPMKPTEPTDPTEEKDLVEPPVEIIQAMALQGTEPIVAKINEGGIVVTVTDTNTATVTGGGLAEGTTMNLDTDSLTITGNNGTDGAKVVEVTVDDGVTQSKPVQITINNVSIKASSSDDSSAFALNNGAEVQLTLSEENILESGMSRGGLEVPEGCILTIDKETNDAKDTLTANASVSGAGIGGGKDSDGGNITILGGTVTVHKNTEAVTYGAGIGGGKGGDGGTISISGSAIVTVSSSSKYSGWGAGIGGGEGGAGGTISIAGNATVTAYSAEASNGSGAGIGGGYGGAGGTISISDDAEVTAASSQSESGYGAGIGGGIGGAGGTIVISGGTVTAYSSQSATGYGAGIGGGYSDSADNEQTGGAGGTITISGGALVEAYSGGGYMGNGAGIGGGAGRTAQGGTGGEITIFGATTEVTACSGQSNAGFGAGIGGGASLRGNTGGSGGKITISDGTVMAYSSQSEAGYGAGIGGGGTSDVGTGDVGTGGAGGTITINGGTVTAYSSRDNVGYGAGIGGGRGKYLGGAGGTITINDGTVTSCSSRLEKYSGNGAGIGGGSSYIYGSELGVNVGGAGGTITITGGIVRAASGAGSSNGAGIGGGRGNKGTGGSGGTITITGGTVTALSSLSGKDNVHGYGAGIGGGEGKETGGAGGTITISGGIVSSMSGFHGYGAGIGGGEGKETGGAGGTITITGGSVWAGSDGTDIGAIPTNGKGDSLKLSVLQLDGENTKWQSIVGGDIGDILLVSRTAIPSKEYGVNDVETNENSSVYFWLPEVSKGTTANLEREDGKFYSGDYSDEIISGGAPYTVTLSEAGTINYLTDLKVDKGTMSPVFDPEGEEAGYTVLVGYSSKDITVTATADDGNQIKINGKVVESGVGETITLRVGANPITVQVEGSGDTYKAYRVTVTREKDSSGNSGSSGSKASVEPSPLKPDMTVSILDENDKILKNFDTAKMSSSDGMMKLDAQQYSDVKWQIPLSAMDALASKDNDGYFKFMLDGITYFLPYDYENINGLDDFIDDNDLDLANTYLRLSITQLEGSALAKAIADYEKQFNGESISSFYEIELGLYDEDGKKLNFDASQFEDAVRFTLETEGIANGGFVYQDGRFLFVPMKATSGSATFTTTHHSVYVAGKNTMSFVDVASADWFYSQVVNAANKGLVSGIGAGLYSPSTNVTRAEFIQMISNVLQLPEAERNTEEYIDVANSHWGYEAIMTLKSAGMLEMFGGMTLLPSQPITREEMTIILAEAMDYVEYEADEGDMNISQRFADYTDMTEAYHDSIQGVVDAGIMSGMSEDTFGFKGETTRAQAATVLMNFVKTVGLV